MLRRTFERIETWLPSTSAHSRTDPTLAGLPSRPSGGSAQTERQLMACSDRVLADIGIAREDIPLVARGRTRSSTRPASAVRLARGPARLAGGGARRRRELRRIRRELAAYNDRDLDDLGIRRSDIPALARSAPARAGLSAGPAPPATSCLPRGRQPLCARPVPGDAALDSKAPCRNARPHEPRQRGGARWACTSASYRRACSAALRQGGVFPAHPLALNRRRELDPVRQRALSRYYVDAGAGGPRGRRPHHPVRDPRGRALRAGAGARRRDRGRTGPTARW